MRLFLLVALTMTAFAGNSVLNRYAVGNLGTDPMMFALIRTVAGAVTLTGLIVAMGARPTFTSKQVAGGTALAVYMLGFSWAYLSLDAGLGALILFGVLQIAMFGFAVWRGQTIAPLRWIGAGFAICGLTVLLWPTGAASVPFGGAVAMVAAGLAWAAYTLLGQGAQNATAASAGNFIICVPLVLVPALLSATASVPLAGALTAIIAGAVTSGLGYALWYRVLPQIATTTAAISQLSVPVIAVAAGVVLLGEPLTARLVLAGGLVIGGIAISVLRPA